MNGISCVLIISITRFKSASIVIGGHVLIILINIDTTKRLSETHPEATHHIVDVLTIPGSVGAYACTEAEFGVGNERCPFMILPSCTERVAEDQATDRVAITVSAVRVQLSTSTDAKSQLSE